MKRQATLLFLCFAALSCAHGPSGDVVAVRSKLDQVREEFAAAETAGSTDRMRVHVTPDVVMMAPNMPAVSGAENAMEAMNVFFAAFAVQIAYQSDEIVVADGWAFDRGTYKQVLTPRRGGTAMSDSGKYLWLYRREPDGRWRQARVIWNSSNPAATPPSNSN